MLGSSYHLVSKSSALAPGTSSPAWVLSCVSPFRLVRVVRLCPCCVRRVVRDYRLVRPYRATPFTLVVLTVRAVFRVVCVGCVRSRWGLGVRLVVVVSLV